MSEEINKKELKMLERRLKKNYYVSLVKSIPFLRRILCIPEYIKDYKEYKRLDSYGRYIKEKKKEYSIEKIRLHTAFMKLLTAIVTEDFEMQNIQKDEIIANKIMQEPRYKKCREDIATMDFSKKEECQHYILMEIMPEIFQAD